jgi:hypothetical protein
MLKLKMSRIGLSCYAREANACLARCSGAKYPGAYHLEGTNRSGDFCKYEVLGQPIVIRDSVHKSEFKL